MAANDLHDPVQPQIPAVGAFVPGKIQGAPGGGGPLRDGTGALYSPESGAAAEKERSGAGGEDEKL